MLLVHGLLAEVGSVGLVISCAARCARHPTGRASFVAALISPALLQRLGLFLVLGLASTTERANAQPTTVLRPPPDALLQDRARADSIAVSAAGSGAQPVATIDRARIQRALGGSAASLSVARPGGITEALRQGDPVRIAPGDFVFARMSDTARVLSRSNTVMPGGRPSTGGVSRDMSELLGAATTYSIPYRWLMVDSAGVQRLLVPFFILRGGGLTYDIADRTYKGTAFVGVEDTLHHGEGPVPLPSPLQLMLATTDGGSVSPTNLGIRHTSLEYDSVRIESPDATVILLRTGTDRVGITIPIPVRALIASLIPDQRTLQGFGLATTEISVSLPRGVSRADTAVVTFTATGAPVKPTRLRVAGGSESTVKLRSGMPGPDSIRAYIDGVLVAETIVMMKPPWPFLQATLVGVLLGGAARWAPRRRKRARFLARDIVSGMPFGVIAAAAISVGLSLLPVSVEDPTAWVGTMVTAALGAWLGSPLLSRLSAGGA